MTAQDTRRAAAHAYKQARDPQFLAAAFEKAADHMAKVGMHRGDLYDLAQENTGTPVEECRVCALGALSFAFFGTPDLDRSLRHLRAPFFAAQRVAREHLRADLYDFNDRQAGAAEDVTKALRDIAAKLREKDIPRSARL